MNKLLSEILRFLTLFLIFAFSVSSFRAGAQNQDKSLNADQNSNKSIFEGLWQLPRLYKNENATIIQEFSLIGRYHGQYWNENSDQGSAGGWENRRVFLGGEAIIFHKLTLHAQIRISNDFNPFYAGLYQAYIKWTPSENFSLSTGRLDYLYTGLERTVSSTKIVTFERSLLTNQLLPNEVVGMLVQGITGKLSYRGGVFSGSINDEFTNFEGGFAASASLGYDLPLLYRSGSIHVDYLYNNGNPSNNAFKSYDHIISVWHQGQTGPVGLGVEFVAAHGIAGNTSVFGVTILPTFALCENLILKDDRLELAIRYHYGDAGGENGVLLQKRYEQEVVHGGYGEKYNSIYSGLNWLLYGDRLKLMTGLEYSVMSDSANDGGSFNGWSYFAGVRFFF